MFTTETYTFVFVILTFMMYLYIGWKSRVQESAGFYVAGQGVPALANGMATAADWMSAASFLSMAGMISALGYDGSIYLMGWTGGYVLLTLLLAPYLRKFGKFTVPDFVAERYYSNTARVVAAIAAVFISLTYVSGQMSGVGIVFSRFLEIPAWQGVVIGMVIVAFFAVLGGMKGITWTQVAQYVVLIAAFLLPAIFLAFQLTGHFLPQSGFAASDLMEKLNGLQTDLGFSQYTQPFVSHDMLNILCITLALMMGTAGLPHVIVRFYTTRTVRAARYSGAWALLFIAILYTTAPALASFARYNLLQTLDGAKVQKVEKPGIDGKPVVSYSLTRTNPATGKDEPITWAEKWQSTGLLKFDDKGTRGASKSEFKPGPPDGVLQMTAVMGGADGKQKVFAEAVVNNDIIVLATPEVAMLPGWVVALVAAGGLAAALSTASGLLLVISSSVAHDLWIHFVDPTASEEKRVKIGRTMIFFGVCLAGYFGINPPGFVSETVAFAFGLAAASFFPAILLGIFDKRTNREGAVAGMLTGLIFTGVYIAGCNADKIFWDKPLMTPWCFGIKPQGIGAVGMLLNLVVTIVVSRLTPPPPQSVQDMVEEVRLPVGSPPPDGHM